MEPINIILPTCMLNPPACDDPLKHAAVAAGNVELSQRVVDMFFGVPIVYYMHDFCTFARINHLCNIYVKKIV